MVQVEEAKRHVMLQGFVIRKMSGMLGRKAKTCPEMDQNTKTSLIIANDSNVPPNAWSDQDGTKCSDTVDVIPEQDSSAASQHLHHRKHALEHKFVAAGEWCKTMGRRASSAMPLTAFSHETSEVSQDAEMTTRGRRSVSLPSQKSSNMAYNVPYTRGICVATKYGTGVINDYRCNEEVYEVELASERIAFMKKNEIIREIKAVVGERVQTRWGYALVESYDHTGDIYSLVFDSRWDNNHAWRMKATTNKFEKIKTSTMGRTVQKMQFTKQSLIDNVSSFREASYASKIYSEEKSKQRRLSKENEFCKHNNEKMNDASRVNVGAQYYATTAFGVGKVLQHREKDQIYIVKMESGGNLFVQVDSVKLHCQMYHINQLVNTRYGPGQVIHYRENDNIYEIVLDANGAHLYIAGVAENFLPLDSDTADRLDPSKKITRRLTSMFSKTRDSIHSKSFIVKNTASTHLNTISNVTAKVSAAASFKITFPILQSLSSASKFSIGERVITNGFGSGIIEEYRDSDRVYKLVLRRSGWTGYFHEASLQAFPYSKVTHVQVNGNTVPLQQCNGKSNGRKAFIAAALQSARSQSVHLEQIVC